MTKRFNATLIALLMSILLFAGACAAQTPTFSYLVAPEPRLDASINDGHRVLTVLGLAGFSHPRLYGNTIAGGANGSVMIPELKEQSDTALWVDVSRDLVDLGVPTSLPIYLQFRVDEIDNYYNVAQTVAMLNAPDPIYGLNQLMAILNIGAQSNQRVLQVISNLPGVSAAISKALLASMVSTAPAPVAPLPPPASALPIVGACSGGICGVTANTPSTLVDGQNVPVNGIVYVFHLQATPFGVGRYFTVTP